MAEAQGVLEIGLDQGELGGEAGSVVLTFCGREILSKPSTQVAGRHVTADVFSFGPGPHELTIEVRATGAPRKWTLPIAAPETEKTYSVGAVEVDVSPSPKAGIRGAVEAKWWERPRPPREPRACSVRG